MTTTRYEAESVMSGTASAGIGGQILRHTSGTGVQTLSYSFTLAQPMDLEFYGYKDGVNRPFSWKLDSAAAVAVDPSTGGSTPNELMATIPNVSSGSHVLAFTRLIDADANNVYFNYINHITRSAPATTQSVAKLNKAGFSVGAAKALRTDLVAATPEELNAMLRRGDLTPRQMRTLRNPAPNTMSKLLRGGFTRHQAKLILGG